MIKARSYKGSRIGVLGLARSGLAAARALRASGAEVFAWDDGAKGRAAADFPLHDLNNFDIASLEALCLSPGIPHGHPVANPVALKAKAAGVPLIGDIEIFARARADLPAHDLVAITGTNGKSTTTALMHHVLSEAGRETAMAGNIGTGVLGLDPLGDDGVYIFELSSYQLELTETLAPDVAILLNIAPDHLERHGGMAGYVAAKRRLFDMQRADQIAIVGVDDENGAVIAGSLAQEVIPVSVKKPVAGIYVVEGRLFDGRSPPARDIGSLLDMPALVGRHNWQNAAAAYAAATTLGVDDQTILAAFRTFPGLAHRLERVAERDGVLFVNDSKATNLDSAAVALAAYDNIYWIAGGRPKDTDLSSLAGAFGKIRRAFLVGEAMDVFETALAGKVKTDRAGTIDVAVRRAHAAARKSGGGVVLLSPAAASFDQFLDFEERGDAFKAAVAAILAGESA